MTEDSAHGSNSDNLVLAVLLLHTERGLFVIVDGDRDGAYRCCPDSLNHAHRFLSRRLSILLRVVDRKTTQRDSEHVLVHQFMRMVPHLGYIGHWELVGHTDRQQTQVRITEQAAHTRPGTALSSLKTHITEQEIPLCVHKHFQQAWPHTAFRS